MKLRFTIGENEKTELVIYRNWFTGGFFYIENGQKKSIKNALNPATHFSVKTANSYEFVIGEKEQHLITIRHTRYLLLAGFRPQLFKVFVNEKLLHEHKGY